MLTVPARLGVPVMLLITRTPGPNFCPATPTFPETATDEIPEKPKILIADPTTDGLPIIDTSRITILLPFSSPPSARVPLNAIEDMPVKTVLTDPPRLGVPEIVIPLTPDPKSCPTTPRVPDAATEEMPTKPVTLMALPTTVGLVPLISRTTTRLPFSSPAIALVPLAATDTTPVRTVFRLPRRVGEAPDMSNRATPGPNCCPTTALLPATATDDTPEKVVQ